MLCKRLKKKNRVCTSSSSASEEELECRDEAGRQFVIDAAMEDKEDPDNPEEEEGDEEVDEGGNVRGLISDELIQQDETHPRFAFPESDDEFTKAEGSDMDVENNNSDEVVESGDESEEEGVHMAMHTRRQEEENNEQELMAEDAQEIPTLNLRSLKDTLQTIDMSSSTSTQCKERQARHMKMVLAQLCQVSQRLFSSHARPDASGI